MKGTASQDTASLDAAPASMVAADFTEVVDSTVGAASTAVAGSTAVAVAGSTAVEVAGSTAVEVVDPMVAVAGTGKP